MADQDLLDAQCGQAVLDVHTHLTSGQLSARGLHDILLYHMVTSELHAAGCPSGARLTEFPGTPGQAEAHQRLAEAVPYLPRIANTSTWWGARIILEDLYHWREPITEGNWRRLDGMIRERADDRAWHREVLARANIAGACAEHCRRGKGLDDDVLSHSVRMGHVHAHSVGRVRHCGLRSGARGLGAGRPEDGPCMIGANRRPADRHIRTLADVHTAIGHYIERLPYGAAVSMATGISTDIDYRLPSDAEMEAAIQRRGQAGPAERDIYAAYIGELMLAGLERHGHEIAFQFSLGAEPLPPETMSRISQKTLAQPRRRLIARHPGLRFQCFVASRHAHQTLCTMARQLPNFSIAGFWWHTFFPGTIRQLMEERLDMVPMNKQCGFFSDAYCVEWAYAKARIVRMQMAEVYGAKVRQGQYTRQDALAIARAVLFESPQGLLGMRPGRLRASTAV